MDPVTAGLLVAANFAASVYSNRQKAKINRTQIDLEVEQAKLQAEERAYESTKQFREFISYNAALSAMGYGGATGFRGVSATATANVNKDLAALNRQQRYADISGMSARASNQTNLFAGNVKAGIDSVLLAKDLGLFNKDDKEKALTGLAGGK